MNISITINDDNQVIVEQENSKKRTIGKPVLVFELELANYLLSKEYSMRKILPNTNTNEGLIFSFHNVEGIKQEMKKWNWQRHQTIREEIIPENEAQE